MPPQERPLDQATLPRLGLLEQPGRLAGQRQPVRRQPLGPQPGVGADRVAVVLPQQVQRAVGVPERTGVDRAADVGLADQRAGPTRRRTGRPAPRRPPRRRTAGRSRWTRPCSRARNGPPRTRSPRAPRSCPARPRRRSTGRASASDGVQVDQVGRGQHRHVAAIRVGVEQVPGVTHPDRLRIGRIGGMNGVGEHHRRCGRRRRRSVGRRAGREPTGPQPPPGPPRPSSLQTAARDTGDHVPLARR